MPVEVLMPQMGESVDEATVTKWLKAKGDPVEEYEALLEVNTDKVDTEIPSPVSGVLLDILIPEGETVQAGSLLAWIGEAGEDFPAAADRAVQVSDIPAPSRRSSAPRAGSSLDSNTGAGAGPGFRFHLSGGSPHRQRTSSRPGAGTWNGTRRSHHQKRYPSLYRRTPGARPGT